MRRVTVRGIIIHDGKLLCMQLKPYRRSEERDFWCTPGGGIDDGESLLDALHREMVEETGIAPIIGSLLYVQQYRESAKEEQLEFFFEIKNGADYLNIDLSNTTHGDEEVAVVDFIDPSATDILPAFLTTDPIAERIAQNWPPAIFASL